MSDAERISAVLADAPMTETEIAVAAGVSLTDAVKALNVLQNEKRVKAVLEADGLVTWSLA